MQAELPERKPEAERAPAEAEAEPARRSRCTSRVASRAASRRNSADATVGAELAARAASAAAGAPAASEAAPPGSGTAEVVIDVRTEQPPTSARRPAHAPSAVVRDASPSSDPGGSATPPERSADADLVPAYTQWPSKSRFYLSGRLMTGPSADDRLRLGTWAALLGPFVAFFVAAGADLRAEICWLFVALALLLAIDVALLAATAYTDPGVIPRAPGGHCKPPNNSHFKFYDVDGVRVTECWCTTCSIWRAPGVSHCRDCDNCVADWDHHCPFVGNCIGRRNYGYFTAFLASISLSAATMAAACVVVSTGGEWERFYSPSKVATMAVAAILLFALAIGLVIGCFTCFHITLIFSNLTTKEWCRKRDSTVVPVRGENRLWRVCCACFEPPRIQPLALVPRAAPRGDAPAAKDKNGTGSGRSVAPSAGYSALL